MQYSLTQHEPILMFSYSNIRRSQARPGIQLYISTCVARGNTDKRTIWAGVGSYLPGLILSQALHYSCPPRLFYAVAHGLFHSEMKFCDSKSLLSVHYEYTSQSRLFYNILSQWTQVPVHILVLLMDPTSFHLFLSEGFFSSHGDFLTSKVG